MRLAHAPWLVGLSILCSGCALFEDAGRNACYGLSSVIQTHRENKRNREWADAAWQQVCASLPPGQRSEDYAQGFKDGYAEYLFRGGNGEQPLLPPPRYRHMRYQNPQGYQAIEDWFAGYRHGAGVAHDTGARKWITGPSALAPELHEIEVQEAAAHKARPSLAAPKEITTVSKEITAAPEENPATPPLRLPEPAVASPEAAPIRPEIPQFTVPVPRPIPDDEAEPWPVPTNPTGMIRDAAPNGGKILMVAEPPPEPARAKITTVAEPPPEPARAKITTVAEPPPEPARAKITTVAEPPPEPARAKITNVIEPPAEPARARITNVIEPPVEPVRAKITNVIEPPVEPVRARIITVMEPPVEPARAKITNVIEPPVEPMRAKITSVTEPPVEPGRARITTITVTPNKE